MRKLRVDVSAPYVMAPMHMNPPAETKPDPLTVDPVAVRRIALETLTNERSVRKELSGGHVRGFAGERIRQALRAAGLR
jgi:hypothetical protein